MKRRTLHVLYEHGADQRPFGSAYIRLLRPLTHPAIRASVEATPSLRYEGQPVDAVVVDRLWRPDILPALAQTLAADAHRAGARLLYALDDDFLNLATEKKDWEPTDDQLSAVRFLLRRADGVLVTTQPLKERLSAYNPHIAVVPNALDEQLLPGRDVRDGPGDAALRRGSMEHIRRAIRKLRAVRPGRRLVIGYMGTLTHDDDLLMILPALRTVCQRYRGKVEIQLVGVAHRPATLQALHDLPVRSIHPGPAKAEYPLFVPWFTSRLHWDLAISPLRDTTFNRCKSDIKFLDYCAIGVAGIYSAAPAYASTVRHGETGWLVENDAEAWTTALEALLSDAELRARLAQNATRYLYTQRTLARSSHHWLAALETLLGDA